jgi:broad specificity phosphatase PhoE
LALQAHHSRERALSFLRMGAIYLIRHGQASFGFGDYDRLSELGVEQSRVLGMALKARVPQIDAVLCGLMRRQRATAEHCLAAMGLPQEWRESTAWNEYDHIEVIRRFEPRYADHETLVAEMRGSLGGVEARRRFREMFARAVARWVSGRFDHEYAESWTAFRARVRAGLHEAIDILGPSKTALVFTSGGAITAICGELLNVPDARLFELNWTIANASTTKIIYGARGAYLSTLNEHPHFEGEASRLLTYR